MTADIEQIAAAYTAAWNSGSAQTVATFFAQKGTIVINRGTLWEGRDGIAAMAAGFFADVPDLLLTCDGLRSTGDHVAYLWTFVGHHAQTGNLVHISGWEEWDLDDDCKVLASRGWYNANDYAQQVAA